MRRIPLKNREEETIAYAEVDDDVYDTLMEKRWHIANGYAIHSITKSKQIRMHRLIYEIKIGSIDGKTLDHADRDKLNNQIANLRECTFSQNCSNKVKYGKNPRSLYKGVSLVMDPYVIKKWMASFKHNSRRTTVGTFYAEKDAAIAHDIFVREIKGDFAVVNFPELSKEETERVLTLIPAKKLALLSGTP